MIPTTGTGINRSAFLWYNRFDRAITITTSTGEAEITASAMAYVDLLFFSDFVTEAEEYALVAYYYYYLAALEY